MSSAAFINTTPHNIHLYKDGEIIMTYYKSPHPLRLIPAETKTYTIGNVPVVSAPRYVDFEGTLPENAPILVSVPVGHFLTERRIGVFGPDVGPLGVVRNDLGGIIGTKRFVQYS